MLINLHNFHSGVTLQSTAYCPFSLLLFSFCQFRTGMEGDRLMCHIFLLLAFVNFHFADKDTNKNKEAMLYDCINNCAMCVEHWEEGLYNGPRCARQCMKHKGQKIVDPDCSKLKMFNYDPEVIKKHRKYMREQAKINEATGA